MSITDELREYSTEGLTYKETSVYYNEELAEQLKAVEVAIDDGKIVNEATFALTSSKFNDITVNILKFIYGQKKR